MHDLGILGRFLPEFEGLTCLVQHELPPLHCGYSYSEHHPNLDEVFYETTRHIKFRECLRLYYSYTSLPVLLLHDIGKSKGIKGHT